MQWMETSQRIYKNICCPGHSHAPYESLLDEVLDMFSKIEPLRERKASGCTPEVGAIKAWGNIAVVMG